MTNRRGQIFAILNRANVSRAERLAILSHITARPIGSTNDLTAPELERVAGTLFSWDAAGHLDAQLAEILGRKLVA